jgi:hypothetical protein
MQIDQSIGVHGYKLYLMLENFMKNCTTVLDVLVAKTEQKYEA